MLETHTELYHRVTWYTELMQFHLCFFSKDKKEKELNNAEDSVCPSTGKVYTLYNYKYVLA